MEEENTKEMSVAAENNENLMGSRFPMRRGNGRDLPAFEAGQVARLVATLFSSHSSACCDAMLLTLTFPFV